MSGANSDCALTVLHARNRRLAKFIDTDGSVVGYDRARLFDAVEIPLRDLDSSFRHRGTGWKYSRRGGNAALPAFGKLSRGLYQRRPPNTAAILLRSRYVCRRRGVMVSRKDPPQGRASGSSLEAASHPCRTFGLTAPE